MEEKNRKFKKIITATSIGLLVIIIVIAVVFCIMKSRKYKYHVNENGTITIDKYLGHETDVVIPERIRGIEVTELGLCCFEDNESVVYIHLPNSVNCIGVYAFASCPSLEKVSGGENVKIIWDGVFSLDKKLTSVPDFSNVEMIMNSAFFGCDSLKEITVSDKLRYIGVLAFSDTGISYSIIPDSMETLGTYAFSKTEYINEKDDFIIVGDGILINYPDIETVEVPEGIKFVTTCKSGIKKVKKFIVPNTANFVDSDILEKTEGSVIYIPESVEKIGEYSNGEYEEEAFLDVSKIYGIEDSYAQEYAERYGIEFEAVEPWY